MSLISVNHLSKSFKVYSSREGISGSIKDLFHREYRTLKAVDQISFEVGEGELLGYIGPNGAGKSTSIKMLTGILKPTSGEMSVLGYHPFRDRKKYTSHIGVVFGQRTQLWWDIAVIESLKLLGRIYRVPNTTIKERIEQLTEILDLSAILHSPVRKLSLGQRVRSDLAASLIHNPRVLFLDEPTIGLDAVGKDAMRSFLRRINREYSTTIILTTHDLNEIDALCKRMIIIDKGSLIYDGGLAAIKSLPGLTRTISLDFATATEITELQNLFNSTDVSFEQESSRRILGRFNPNSLPTVELIKTLVEKYDIADFAVNEPAIEDIVMKIYREGIPKAKNHEERIGE